ncbi:hypothetical protein BGW38_001198 [Lunasporangiospora selenospora]|uniref:Mss4-like protein n=1 Tax=Lunasporangiospora selenospora TaxID=979761 RepID=A0A9P6FTR8_9FUNG|nr:hypothetical protein BGW38_001198 [Lunasporangiospora selenospora]
MTDASRNPGRSFGDFQEQDLIAPHPSNADTSVNRFEIYCPQSDCRCKILLASTATLEQRAKSKLSLANLPREGAAISSIEDNTAHDTATESETTPTSGAGDVAASEDTQAFWRVSDMMAFENIGFSKKLPNGIQLLSCADCDTGPLGYHETVITPGVNKEYLIALNRVRYYQQT